MLRSSHPCSCEYSRQGRLGRFSGRTIKLDTAGRTRGLDVRSWANSEAASRAGRTLGRQQSTEATLRGGFHRRERKPNQERSTDTQGARGLSHEEPRATSDSDQVPSARRSTRDTVGEGSEKAARLWTRVVLNVNTWGRPTSLLPGWPTMPP